MAYEKTEPRNNQILLWGGVSVLTLVALVPLFHSYFGITFRAELADKVYEVPNTPYEELRDAQRGALRDAPISVDRALEQLATRGRTNTPVMPRPNDTPDKSEADYEASLAPLVGWAQLQQEREAEQARRAMRARRQRLAAEAAAAGDSAAGADEGPDEDDALDAPSAALDAPPARDVLPRLPARLVRPTVMVAGVRSAPMEPAPSP